jgi:putative membrane protein
MLISIFLGIILGILTGFFPGIHVNLINIILVQGIFNLNNDIDSIYLALFILSLSVSNIFFSFIPSVFLGCPEEETSLSVLPGHKLLMKGEGYKAVRLTSKGILIGSFIFIILTPILLFTIPYIYEKINKILFFILLIASLFLVLKEKNKKIAFFIFLLSGILGYFSLNSKVNQPLLPLFTGLFGVPLLLTNLKNKTKIQKQKIKEPKLRLNFKIFLSMILSSVLCGFLPGLGSSQAIVLGSIFQKISTENFLFLSGAVNILILGISLIGLFSINKTRTGTAVALKEIFNNLITLKELIFLIFILILTSLICYFSIKKISRKVSLVINKVNYQKISFFVLFFIGILTLIVSGFKGMIILFVASLLGIYTNSYNISKTQMMGCLLIPTMLYYV